MNEAENSFEMLAQCVPLIDDNLDSYCEDQLSRTEYYDNPVVDEHSEKVLAEAKVCSPFAANKKQLLSCRLVEKKCAYKFDNLCLDLVEIAIGISSCPGFNTCRAYKHPASSDKSSRCITAIDSLCLDRFWNLYAEDVLDAISRKETKNEITFKFCDPYRKHKQLECQIGYKIMRVKKSEYRSILPPEEHMKLQQELKFAHPLFYSHLFSEIYSSESIQINVDSIKVIHHLCQMQPEYLGEIESNAVDPKLAVSGSVCKQFSRTVSRCMPPSAIDASNINKLYKNPNLPMLSLEDTIEPYAGFCAGRNSPGQYCVPGWPDVGVLCPFGKLISCKRPEGDSKGDRDDLDASIERCVQMFGNVPPVSNSSSDAFRKVQIIDLHGREITYGWYSKCHVGSLDQLKDLP